MQFILTGKSRLAFDRLPVEIEPDDLTRNFTISAELSGFLTYRRGGATKLDTALRWCWLEYLGWQPIDIAKTPTMVSSFVARQLGLRGFKPEAGTPRTERFRNATVREAAGWSDFDLSHYDALKLVLASDAIHRPDKRLLLEATLRWCFDHRVVRPGLTMLERLLASVVETAEEAFEAGVIGAVSQRHHEHLLETMPNRGVRLS